MLTALRYLAKDQPPIHATRQRLLCIRPSPDQGCHDCLGHTDKWRLVLGRESSKMRGVEGKEMDWQFGT